MELLYHAVVDAESLMHIWKKDGSGWNAPAAERFQAS